VGLVCIMKLNAVTTSKYTYVEDQREL